MLGLRDLENATQTRPPQYAVDVNTLVEHLDDLEVGEREDKHIALRFRGNPLMVNIPVKATVHYQPNSPLIVRLVGPNKRFSTELSKLIYNRIGNSPDVVAMIPKPDLQFGLSRLDQVCMEGLMMAFSDLQQLSTRVRCITPNGESTSISANIEYPATWTIDMSRCLFDPERVTDKTQADFFVCLATPTMCITLDSPTENYGRFG